MKSTHFSRQTQFGWMLLAFLLVGLTLPSWLGATPPTSNPPSTSAPTQAGAQTTTATTSTPQAKATPQTPSLPRYLLGLYVFLLAIFVGFEVITKVPPTLHTPLMSGANAISGITIVGALFCARSSQFTMAKILGFLAVICAMVNVVGGFLVTDRMLKKFKK